MRLGLDLSNFSGVPSQPKLAEIKADGYAWAICGTQTGNDGNNYTQRQIDAFRAAGVEVPAVYVFLYFDGNDGARVADAMKYGLPVWLDVEWTTSGQSPQRIVSVISGAMSQLGTKLCAGIYTGAWCWPSMTGNSTAFSHLPLWHAAYQAQPQDFSGFQPYGGWTKPAIWQWSSDGAHGLNADLNVMEEAIVTAENATTAMALLNAEIRAGRERIRELEAEVQSLKPGNNDAIIELAIFRADAKFRKAVADGILIVVPTDAPGLVEIRALVNGQAERIGDGAIVPVV